MNLLMVDSITWTITILGWLIVFAALVFLIAVFNTVPKIFQWSNRREMRKKNAAKDKECLDNKIEISGETNAAIAMALYMYFDEMHDEESNVITIKEVKRRYSPWSSKIYGMNNTNFPR